MKVTCLIGILLLSSAAAYGQADTGRSNQPLHWYDTLKVTKPVYARVTTAHKLALSAFSILSLPIVTAVGGLTIISPGILILGKEGESAKLGISLSTGMGFGKRGGDMMYYPDVRVQFEAVNFLQSTHPYQVRASVLRDFLITPLNRQQYLWLSTAFGVGSGTDFSTTFGYLESFVGISNPLGIRFLGLYPMHNFGIRLRGGLNYVDGKSFYEISVAATSTF